jgi:hypothetical protein
MNVGLGTGATESTFAIHQLHNTSPNKTPTKLEQRNRKPHLQTSAAMAFAAGPRPPRREQPERRGAHPSDAPAEDEELTLRSAIAGMAEDEGRGEEREASRTEQNRQGLGAAHALRVLGPFWLREAR